MLRGTRTTEKFTHKAAAFNAAAAAEAEAAQLGWRDPRAAAKTWGEWCEAWWDTRNVEPGTLHRDKSSRDSCLLPKWKDVPLIDITRFEVKAWAAELGAAGMAPATVQRRIYLLSASLNAAIDAEILTSNPAFRIKLPGGETNVRRYLTHAEAAHLLAQFSPPMASSVGEDLVPVLLGTGMRWGEAVGLQIARVDFKRHSIRVSEVWDDEMRRLKPYPKGKKIRDVPMPEWIVPHLRHAIADRKTGHAFLQHGRVVDHSNWRFRVWEPAVERSGLDGTRIHDLRHTFASWLIQHPTHPVSLQEVGKLLGHVSSQTTAIYAELAKEHSERVLAALSDPFARVSPVEPPS